MSSREELQRWRYNLIPDHLIGEMRHQAIPLNAGSHVERPRRQVAKTVNASLQVVVRVTVDLNATSA